MGSALFCRTPVVIPLTPSADQRDKEGYLVTISGDTATISSSATVHTRGVILEGNNTDKLSSVGILGALNGSVRLKASGVITKGDRVQQHTDGTVVTDATSGARVIVGTALESGVSGDLIEVATHVPITLS